MMKNMNMNYVVFCNIDTAGTAGTAGNEPLTA